MSPFTLQHFKVGSEMLELFADHV